VLKKPERFGAHLQNNLSNRYTKDLLMFFTYYWRSFTCASRS